MAMTLRCRCGKTLRVKEELAGQRVRCPTCGWVFDIPTQEESTFSTEVAEEESADQPFTPGLATDGRRASPDQKKLSAPGGLPFLKRWNLTAVYFRLVRRLPTPVRISIHGLTVLTTAAMLGLAISWWSTYTGPYRWLAEWQVRMGQMYAPAPTGILVLMVSVAVGIVPGLLAAFLLVSLKVFPPPSGLEIRPHAFDPNAWLRGHIGRMAGLTLGLVWLTWGAVLTFSGQTAGPLTEVRLADLEAGGRPPSRWVRVQGQLLWDRTRSEQEMQYVSHYVPLVSQQWQPGNPVALYLKVRPEQRDKLNANPTTLEGTLAVGGLPGMVRTAFERQGPLPAPGHEVLELGNRPERDAEFGHEMLWMGLIASALTGLVWVIKAVRSPGVTPSGQRRQRARTSRLAMTLSCRCGKTLRVQEASAGKSVRCPACGRVFDIPPGDEPTLSTELIEGDSVGEAITVAPQVAERPIAEPEDARAAPPGPDRPTYTLYSPAVAVKIALILFDIFGACAVLAINLRRLGRTRTARKVFWGGLVANLVYVPLFAGSMYLVQCTGIHCLPVIILFYPVHVIAIHFFARRLQGRDYAKHLRSRGGKASSGRAFLIGLACLPVSLVALLVPSGALLLYHLDVERRETLYFGPEESIRYTDGATQADARKLGALFQEVGWFTGKSSIGVTLAKRGDVFIISFYLGEGDWDKPNYIATYQRFQRKASEEVFNGQPIEIHFLDTSGNTHRILNGGPLLPAGNLK